MVEAEEARDGRLAEEAAAEGAPFVIAVRRLVLRCPLVHFPSLARFKGLRLAFKGSSPSPHALQEA